MCVFRQVPYRLSCFACSKQSQKRLIKLRIRRKKAQTWVSDDGLLFLETCQSKVWSFLNFASLRQYLLGKNNKSSGLVLEEFEGRAWRPSVH